MRALRFLVPALLTAVAALGGTTVAHAAPAKYVALGDSYAVGVGTWTYDNSSDACRRGPLAYPRLWAAAHPSTTFVEASCSGARTADVLNTQVPKLTADTTLVTIQVGGNDAGFVDVLKQCILTIDDKDCVNRVEQAKNIARTTVSPALATTYAAVRQAAPSAKVIVVGYPRMYKIGGNCGIFGLSDTERTALNSAADVIAEITAARAADAGFTFLDARGTFDGHGICTSTPWLTSLEWSKLDESYHPNTAGHRSGYLAPLTAITG
ncbi:GDSL-like Lipase/Acylhydrolase family protein [Amycolatopsis xylanica]|uniref:GDSL-like Lipase/Acylhydrolase family protein n=1 Tax=Amycolatopsis xylanica TaxID=589385 RepID=A0A1H3HH64_9PSEU|nr:SGNH/GDSL hydrolase family protein [Amycolatopsis xylanica]SDY14148.1 GDSL-like Lipase/Acylhydrolase family protein [Amycolatopsis xylanica]